MSGPRFTMGMDEISKKRPFFTSPDDLFDDDYYDDQPPEKKRRLTQEQVFKQFHYDNILHLFLYSFLFYWVSGDGTVESEA